jgi:hypothetical protein
MGKLNCYHNGFIEIAIAIGIGIGIEHHGVAEIFDFDSDPDDYFKPRKLLN